MKKVLREILNTSLYLLVVLCLTYLMIHFVGQRTEVRGSSMEPRLTNGDNLIVDKISYRFKDPERFDIIVFPFQYDQNTFYIKRIIGLPGKRFRLTMMVIFILMEKFWKKDMAKKLFRTQDLRIHQLRSEKMSIL